MPIAAGRLAVLLGPTEEGCALATKYVRSNRSGKEARRARDVSRDCQQQK
jgi:hypothetical protein